MGADVQFKMHLPGYYSLRETNDSVDNPKWPFSQSNKRLKREHHADVRITGETRETFVGFGTEQIRRTILKHESIFRHQLTELHRIYGAQRKLMNGMKSKELENSFIPLKTSQPFLYSISNSYEDERKRDHFLGVPLHNSHNGRVSNLRAGDMPSPRNGKHTESKGDKIGVNLNDFWSLEPKGKKPQRHSFDLELPADEYIDNEEKRKGISGASILGSRPATTIDQSAENRQVKMPTSQSGTSEFIEESSSSSFYERRTSGLSDLNEPIHVKEATGDWLGRSKEYCQNLCKESRGVRLNKMHLGNDGAPKECLSDNSNAGNGKFVNGAPLYHENSHTSSKSLQCETGIAPGLVTLFQENQRKDAQQHQRTIFGMEIPVRNHSEPFADSCALGLWPLVQQTEIRNSGPPCTSSSKLPPDGLHRDMRLTLKGPHVSTFVQLGKKCTDFMQSSLDSDVRSVGTFGLAPTTRAEINFCSNLSKSLESECEKSQAAGTPLSSAFSSNISNRHLAFECADPNGMKNSGGLKCRESKTYHPSVWSAYHNMIRDCASASECAHPYVRKCSWDLHSTPNSKSTSCDKVSNIDLNNHHNDSGCRQIFPVDEQGKQETTGGGLFWLEPRGHCNGVTSQENQSTDKTYVGLNKETWEMKRTSFHFPMNDSRSSESARYAGNSTQVGDSSVDRKVLGFSIVDKPRMTENHGTSISFMHKSTDSGIDNDISGIVGVHSCLAQETYSERAGEQVGEKTLVVGKRSSSHDLNSEIMIDLNIGAVEEDSTIAHDYPENRMKNSTGKIEIEQLAPMFSENDQAAEYSEKYPGNRTQKQSEQSKYETVESCEDLKKTAAEAIIAISISRDHVEYQQPEAFLDNPLHQLADIVSSLKGNPEFDGTVSLDEDAASIEDVVPKGLDDFEYMTLNLTETNKEKSYSRLEPPEYPGNGKSGARQPKRGQTGRRRRQKDFQRVILPRLTSLSKSEVTEDLQAFEGLISASGDTWQSSIAKKNANGKPGKGRGRSGGSVSSRNNTSPCQPQIRHRSCRELVLNEGSLTGWGRRTRRMPRHRCSPGHPSVPSK